MTDDTSPRTVVFFPEGAFGPTNNCVGIANVLRQRGHRVIFVVEESFAGTLAAKGFEERLMRLQAPPEVPEEPGQFWKDFIRDTAPHFRKSTTEQLESLILPIWEQLVSGAIYVEERLGEIFSEVQPDVIVQDNVVAFPAVLAAGVPWVRIVSCNPLELPDAASAAGFLRAADRGSDCMGRFSRDLFPAPRRSASHVRRLRPGAWLPGAPGRRVHARLALSHALSSTPRKRTTRERRAWHRRSTASTRPCAPPTRRSPCQTNSRATASSSMSVWAALVRPSRS